MQKESSKVSTSLPNIDTMVKGLEFLVNWRLQYWGPMLPTDWHKIALTQYDIHILTKLKERVGLPANPQIILTLLIVTLTSEWFCVHTSNRIVDQDYNSLKLVKDKL